MCGVAGLLAVAGTADIEASGRRMAAALRHRGPDDEGIWLDRAHGLVLAHRRLSIIDLSPQGHQPMLSASGRYVLAYNGEIYNYLEIREALAKSGKAPVWRGHSDTEVLLAAVEAWGLEPTLRRTVGMFAVALWDRQTATLTLARDRLGEKPLYFGRTPSGFAFASELKAFDALGHASPTVDVQALTDFMQFGYVPAPRSIYRGIGKLPAGHFVTVRSDGSAGVPQAYWELCGEGHDTLTEELARSTDEDLEERLHERLRASVALQMVADVPLGAFLSGGVDSSTVVALMQSHSRQRVRTFTIGFHEKAFDEAPYAKAVAAHIGTDHTELYVSAADAAAVIPDLPRIYDEPFADSSQVPTVLVSRLTRRHVTVSLSGDGGDELFAGYPRYAIGAALWRRIHRAPQSLRAGVGALLQWPTSRAWDGLVSTLAPSRAQAINGQRIHRLGRMLASRTLEEMYVRLLTQWSPEDGLVLSMEGEPIPRASRWLGSGTDIQKMRDWDAHQYLPDDLLVKVDRAAMSASLESRAPLLDHRVAELAAALPERLLLREGQGKWILRRVLDRYVPRALIERPKAGFAIPIAQWLRGPLRGWASDLLDPARLRADGLLDADKVSAMWRQHVGGSFDRSTCLWNVLMFQAWHCDARKGAPVRLSWPVATGAPAMVAP